MSDWSDYEPQAWCVVFNVEAASGWARWVPGRFKHVRAFAFVPKTRVWLFYDVNFSGTNLMAIPGDAHDPVVKAAIANFIGPPGASYVVGMKRLPVRKRWFPWSTLCTAALRHLLHVPGHTLRPDGFHRDCLANGGIPFESDDGSTEIPAPSRRP
jgi:hypothetical protein